ncbi:MAG: arabinofuranosyltransferase, partial [Pseudonocardia sediminis]
MSEAPPGWERTRDRPARGPSVWRVAGELPVAAVVAVGVSAAIQLVVARLPIPAGTNVGLALTAASGFVVAVLLALAGLAHRRRPALTAPLAWIGLSALSTAPLALLLANTRHYLFGVSGDQSFRVQFLTRFADSARPADFAYADIPPYYPTAWFWTGGRLADLFGVEAWAFYKPFAIATMALTGVLAYVLWSAISGRLRALGFATATVLVGLALAPYTPYSWLTAALIAPAAVLGLRLTDAAREPGGPSGAQRNGHRHRWAGSAVVLGLVAGVAGVTHTQMFYFLGLVLVVIVVDGLVRTREARGRYALALLRSAGVLLLVALPLLLLNWTPYLLARLGGARAGGDA